MRSLEKAGARSELSPERSKYNETDRDVTRTTIRQTQGQGKHQKQRGKDTFGARKSPAEMESTGLVFGGATTTFEERTVWNFTVVSSKLLRVPAFVLSLN